MPIYRAFWRIWSSGEKAKATSTSRAISSLKRLFRYLLRQNKITVDPTLQIATPKLPRSLPKSLTEEDVELLLNAPDVDTPLGMRDRTMLEVLYASGLRVSELVGLSVAQVSLDMGVTRVMGKGSKERLVPLGEEALDWVRKYLAEARPALLLGKLTDALFVTQRGEGMTRQMFWYLIKKHAKARRPAQAAVAAHPAPRLRHAPAQPRRGLARGADAAGAFGYFNDADLYACGAGTAEGAACDASSEGIETFDLVEVIRIELTTF